MWPGSATGFARMRCAAIVMCMVLGAGSFGSGNDAGCCRDLSTEVLYEKSMPHPRGRRLGYSSVVDLAFSEGKTRLTIYVPSPDVSPQWYYGPRFLQTADGGLTWNPMPSEVPSPLAITGNTYAQAPSDANVRYRFLHDTGQYLRSEDGGQTWEMPRYYIEGVAHEEFAATKCPPRHCRVEFRLAAIHPRNPLKVYATLRISHWNFETPNLGQWPIDALYVSDDGGDHWELLSETIIFESPLGMSSQSPDVMYATGKLGVVKSKDCGRTWSAVGQQRLMASRPVYRLERELGTTFVGAPSVLEVRQIAVDPANNRIVFVVSNKGIFRSVDGGQTWCLLNLGFDELDSIHSMAILPTRTEELAVGTRYGSFYSTDRGCTFTKIYPGRNPLL